MVPLTSHVAEQATRTKAPGPWSRSAMPAAIRGATGGATSCADAGRAARTAIRQARRTGRGWRTTRRVTVRAFRQVRLPRCDQIPMEAATPLPFAQVRVVNDRLYVDGLVVDDECAVRLVKEAERSRPADDRCGRDRRPRAGPRADGRKHRVRQGRVRARRAGSTRSSWSAHALSASGSTRRSTRSSAPRAGRSRSCSRATSATSPTVAVQNRVKALLAEAQGPIREDLRKQFSADDAATRSRFPAGDARHDEAAVASCRPTSCGHERADAGDGAWDRRAAGREGEAAEVAAAEDERGTAKGRTTRRRCRRDRRDRARRRATTAMPSATSSESAGKKGDVVVGIDACDGPPRGRIVFEAKNSRLSRPKALEELDRALRRAQRRLRRARRPRRGQGPARRCARCASTTATSWSSRTTPRRARRCALEVAY